MISRRPSSRYPTNSNHLEVSRDDFATRYQVKFAQLPAFRHLSPEQYQDKVAELIWEIEEEGEERNGDEVAGVEKILSLNPYEPPTRKTKRSTKPLFHVASKQARIDLEAEFAAFLAQYWEASATLRGGNLEAASWFPEGCYPPAGSHLHWPASASAAASAARFRSSRYRWRSGRPGRRLGLAASRLESLKALCRMGSRGSRSQCPEARDP